MISTNKFPKSIFLVLLFILPLVACPALGQVVQKKQLTPADYRLWGDLNFDKMAPNEKWASYRMRYEGGIDTLFVRNTFTHQTYSFPSAENSLFIKNNDFICQRGDTIEILNLGTGQQETIAGVKGFDYSQETDQLIVLCSAGQDKHTLRIKSLWNNNEKAISDVISFSLNPNGKQLLYTQRSNGKNSVFLLRLDKLDQPQKLLGDSAGQYSHFTWHKKGKAVVFLGEDDAKTYNSLYFYAVEKDRLYRFNPSNQSNFPKHASIVYHSIYKLLISDDLQNVLFTIQYKPAVIENGAKSKVEVWNGNDKFIYPAQARQESAKVALWKPMESVFMPIATAELPSMMLTGDQRNVILSNPAAYEPQFDFEGPRDFYIQNLATGEKQLFLKKHSGSYQYTLPSPNGKYIAYFTESNWWVYDIALQRHTNITAKLKEKFFGKVNLLASNTAFGNPGWSGGDKEILLYDEYDLWAIAPDGSSFRRLTHGRESQISFRLADIPNEYAIKGNYDGRSVGSFDLEKELFLKAIGEDGKTGFYKWKRSTSEKPIVYGDYKANQLHYSIKKQLYSYVVQRFDVAPRIMTKIDAGEEKLFFQSNPQQEKYAWGRAALIRFQNSKKQDLKGVLLYPANYEPQRKYPMIVKIYELQSNELHTYCRPSYTENGFNPTLLTAQGYFVFMPDIVHEDGNVGPSATDCVVAGTTKVIGLGLVNPAKIGLMGHSFGGYETTFICNHTDLFATAIASGAITDLNTFYLTVGWNTSKSNMWRFATQQWRMNSTPFENPEGFAHNSPLTSIESLKIPLLLWTGKEDHHVDWHQSVEYYLALRRLGKKNISLFYPKEGHTLLDPTNQKDLTERVQQWFCHFLKDERPASWISEGL